MPFINGTKDGLDSGMWELIYPQKTKNTWKICVAEGILYIPSWDGLEKCLGDWYRGIYIAYSNNKS